MESLYLDAANCKNTSRPPIWMMRQAGRYLPEYRALRKRFGFIEMMKTPDLATEITLQPIDRFGFDAAILFSDILVTAEVLGSKLSFQEKVGPVISNPIRSLTHVKSIKPKDIQSSAGFVFDAIKQLTPECEARKVPLIGFCGAPFTVASYMIEGGSSTDLKETKQLMSFDPLAMHSLLEKLTDVTLTYLKAQILSGVRAVQIFDTWVSHLSSFDFEEFSLPYIKKIIEGLSDNPVPIALYTRHTSSFVDAICHGTNINVLSIDWQSHIKHIRNKVPRHIALQGNLDPLCLLGRKEDVINNAKKILHLMKDEPGFIFNLGHGITPPTPLENVYALVETVKAW
jgi:uroporphyrinogen decarboxylase